MHKTVLRLLENYKLSCIHCRPVERNPLETNAVGNEPLSTYDEILSFEGVINQAYDSRRHDETPTSQPTADNSPPPLPMPRNPIDYPYYLTILP